MLVAVGLLVLVLALSLAAFFGVRALLGDDPADQPTTSQGAMHVSGGQATSSSI